MLPFPFVAQLHVVHELLLAAEKYRWFDHAGMQPQGKGQLIPLGKFATAPIPGPIGNAAPLP